MSSKYQLSFLRFLIMGVWLSMFLVSVSAVSPYLPGLQQRTKTNHDADRTSSYDLPLSVEPGFMTQTRPTDQPETKRSFEILGLPIIDDIVSKHINAPKAK